MSIYVLFVYASNIFKYSFSTIIRSVMDYHQVSSYLLTQPESELTYPFTDSIDVYKVKGKMFATLSVAPQIYQQPSSTIYWMNLKCDPDEAILLQSS